MKTDTLFIQNVEQLADSIKQVKVQIYMPDQICAGYICCPSNQRLLDVLNGPSGRLFYADKKFLCVSRFEKTHGGHKKPAAEILYVNKGNILLVAETGIEHAMGLGGRRGIKPYPFLDKVPHMVKLHLSSNTTLVGKLHYPHGQEIGDVLNVEARFLPMTEVEILAGHGTSNQRVDFAAVNKDRIICLENA